MKRKLATSRADPNRRADGRRAAVVSDLRELPQRTRMAAFFAEKSKWAILIFAFTG